MARRTVDDLIAERIARNPEFLQRYAIGYEIEFLLRPAS